MNQNFLSTHASKGNIDVDAIIPVYNEAGKVGHVLGVLRKIDLLRKIIVVDDGSTDATREEIYKEAEIDHRIRILIHQTNLGKGQSILSARQTTHSKTLLLLDGDLLGLEPRHILDLIMPVIDDNADMTIGQFKHSYWQTDFAHWITPWLSGQRCLKADLLDDISQSAAAGYGIEMALTIAAQQYEWRCMRVHLKGVWHQPSEKRRGFWSGLKVRAKMYAQITRAWFLASGSRKNNVKAP